ncbi:MAG: hypothetical protein QMD46_00150 [Methanomicrobiales archaeon]|nr:hypothetical protein [Methanomicrobiales archaeon]MDI6875837.1 hypothetical protein [Methanomicrobiales archaeon]
MNERSPLRTWIFLFLIEFAAVLWAQFLWMQGVPVETYVGLNMLVIGCNIFAVLSEMGVPAKNPAPVPADSL